MQEKIYNADIYLRLSKEDGDKEESNSIANQRAMLLDFANSMSDIRVHKIRIDDGYSGVDFSRPAFNEMLNDVKAGVVNCIIVKDFSRFGRNYIEAGKYIQVLFPRAGIRFIAVNDSYDSAKEQGYTDNIIVPFKNMINDAYCADISTKVRSHLDLKRRKGDFVGAFASYGYSKDAANHNRLIIDEFAADVVKDIFVMKQSGMSALSIAERLNESGILSPMEYKRHMGLRFASPFKLNHSAKWQAKAVTRILTNEIYTGVLEQGKRVTPNYKVRKRVELPKEKWTRVENAHEPIVERQLFDTVQELLKLDTRAASKSSGIRPLSGIIFCADCGATMVHKTNKKNGKRYGYYVCANHRVNKDVCSTHIINSVTCETAVFAAVKAHIISVLDIEKIKYVDDVPHSQGSIRRLMARLEAKHEEIVRDKEYKLSLHESYRDGVINREDFVSFKATYDSKIRDAEIAVAAIEKEIEIETSTKTQGNAWISIFKSYADAEELSRSMVVELLERVVVHEKGRVSVNIRYTGELELMQSANDSPGQTKPPGQRVKNTEGEVA